MAKQSAERALSSPVFAVLRQLAGRVARYVHNHRRFQASFDSIILARLSCDGNYLMTGGFESSL